MKLNTFFGHRYYMMHLLLIMIVEILQQLIKPTGKRLRPSLDEKSCPVKLKKVIESCWDEDPNLRPSLKQVMASMTEIAGDK